VDLSAPGIQERHGLLLKVVGKREFEFETVGFGIHGRISDREMRAGRQMAASVPATSGNHFAAAKSGTPPATASS
jgi:hypothetical protein